MRHSSFNCALLALIALVATTRADIIATWNGTTGNWSEAARWSGGVTPQNSGPDLYDAVIGAGTVTLNQAITINQLAMSGGTLDGAGPLTLLEGIAASGGLIALPATGLIQLGAASTSTVSGNVTFSGGVIRGGGGASLTIQPGASLTVGDGANFFAQISSPAWTLTNLGTLTARNTSGGGFTTLDAALAGTGALRVENTGTAHTLSLAGGGVLGGSVHLDANTTLELGGSLVIAPGAIFTGTGTVASAGIVTLGASVAVPALTVPIGELRLAANTLAVTGGALVDDDGTLVVELHGTAAHQIGKLSVNAALSAYGTMRVSLGAGFVPAAGDTFDILDFGSLTGTFASVQLPALPVGRFWRTDRLLTEGVLVASQVPATFAEWQAAFGAGGFDADDDDDGVANGVEFALGLNPTTGSGSNGSVSLPHASLASNRVRLHFEMPDIAANDITLRVEASDDFGRSDPWTPIATKVGAGTWTGTGTVTAAAVGGGRVAITVADTKSVNLTPSRFLRLTITSSP
jgi:hypothetical protein